MQEFIARENIRRFEAQLRQTHDEAQRRTLRTLIAEQERLLESALDKP